MYLETTHENVETQSFEQFSVLHQAKMGEEKTGDKLKLFHRNNNSKLKLFHWNNNPFFLL